MQGLLERWQPEPGQAALLSAPCAAEQSARATRAAAGSQLGMVKQVKDEEGLPGLKGVPNRAVHSSCVVSRPPTQLVPTLSSV